MRTSLNVPYAEKDDAKRLGARWDPAARTWYILGLDPTPFMRWMPEHLRRPAGTPVLKASESIAAAKRARKREAKRAKREQRKRAPRVTHTANEIKPGVRI